MQISKSLFPFILIFLATTPSKAQIIPDSTLGTTVTPNQLILGVLSDRVDGGVISGNNLFHSFQEFNVNTGSRVYFTQPANISNIFTRVTGGNRSNINGRLGVLGDSNLFLINPNGIIFGSGSSLDLKGSFLGTTASSIHFADGTQFSSINPEAIALLTVSVPVGLGFGSNNNPIIVEGTGHKLTGGFPRQIMGTRGNVQLQAGSGKTLALIGGEITLNSGVISTEAGKIEVGAIDNQNQNPKVQIQTTSSGWDFDYSGISQFAPINLVQKALIDASGNKTGNIQLRGSTIYIGDGSLVRIENSGTQTGGNISVKASDTINLHGQSADKTMDSRIITYTLGTGNNGNIDIETKKLLIEGGADIINNTYGRGGGGNITIRADDSIQQQKLDMKASDGNLSTITANVFSSGNASKVEIYTNNLRIFSGGQISSSSFNQGNSATVTINASSDVELIGTTGIAAINVTTYDRGKAGNVELNTRRLRVENGGSIFSSNQNSGSGGTIAINATESITLKGKSSRADLGLPPSSINANTIPLGRNVRVLFGLTAKTPPEGESGSVILNTPQLKVSDGAEISVLNEGIGNAGKLQINADSLSLAREAKLSATTNSRTNYNAENNIILNLRESLILRDRSTINAEAKGQGSGGNIQINVPTIVGLENSDIIANAVSGNGGNINITTQGIFGLENTNKLTANSDISASSKSGVNGIVKITSPDIKPDNSLQQQPSNFINTEQVVASGCLESRNREQGKFVITGNGGLPEAPNNQNMPYSIVQVSETAVSENEQIPVNSKTTPANLGWKRGDPIQEATQLVVTQDGKLVLQSHPGEAHTSLAGQKCQS